MGGLLDTSTPDTAVVSALSANASRYTWVAAAVGSQNAAGLQLATNLPVMAIGGFNGSDPSPTLAQFQAWVQQGKIHYFAASSGRGGFGGRGPGGGPGGFGGPGGAGPGGLGGSGTGSQISAWVQESFTAVTIGGSTFYDLTQPTGSTTSSSASTGAVS